MPDQAWLQRRIERLKNESKISPRNIELILSFIERCAADGLRERRQYKYVHTLEKLCQMLGKDLDKTTKEDIQALAAKINSSDLSEWTKHDYKVTVKKYYKLMEGDEDEPDYFPKKVRWLKSTVREPEYVNPKEILKPEDVDKIVAACDSILHKTICRFLFETGVRAGELLGMKIKDVDLEEGYVVIHGTKTKYSSRTVPIVQSIPLMTQWLEIHPDPDPESHFWCTKKGTGISYSLLSFILKEGAYRAGIRHKRVNPHAWRKASATENSKYLKYPELCAYHGWKIGSDIPMLYIRYTQEDIKKAFSKRTEFAVEKKEIKPNLKKCKRCQMICDLMASFCPRCGFMFSDTDRVAKIQELRKRREKADFLMDVVTQNPQLIKMLEDIMRKEELKAV
jgi:integrase/recombinase XerD